jgi:hypothetical protein
MNEIRKIPKYVDPVVTDVANVIAGDRCEGSPASADQTGKHLAISSQGTLGGGL